MFETVTSKEYGMSLQLIINATTSIISENKKRENKRIDNWDLSMSLGYCYTETIFNNVDKSFMNMHVVPTVFDLLLAMPVVIIVRWFKRLRCRAT